MKAGDLVRFRKAPKLARLGIQREAWHIGLLVEYKTWEKVTTILYEGKMIRVHASDVQKAGKKDGIKQEKKHI